MEPLQAAITPPRKRQIGSDIEEPRAKRVQLTRKNLARFNKMGKKKESKKTSTHHDDSIDDESETTKSISTTSSGFATQARKNGILPPLHSKPPMNLEDIHKQHTKSRTTASPSESDYERYTNAVGKAGNEATMVFEVGGKLLKEYNDKGYNRSFDRSFTGFPKNVGFNNRLSAPQPDYIEGLEVEEYDPFPVDDVDGAVLYEDDPYSLTLPHLAGEWKGRGKDMEKARLQSAYDGAALVYARNQALSHIGKSDPPGYAAITTFATDGTNINFYAHYAAPSDEDKGTLKYHQYQYATANVKDSYQGYKDGRKSLRNAQDNARDQSYALKNNLKEQWKGQCKNILQPIAEGTSLPIPDPQTDTYNGSGTNAETSPYQTGYGTYAQAVVCLSKVLFWE